MPSSSSSSSSSSSQSASSSSSQSLAVEQIPDDLMHDPEHGAAVLGRGGSYPNAVILNVVDYQQPVQQTTRTGVGIGKEFYGSLGSYSDSSCSSSFSSHSSVSSCSSSSSRSSSSSSSYSIPA